MHYIVVLFSGFLFSAGLLVSGMVNPAKVLGFLDIFGDWDASLAFVMGGAVTVTSIGYKYVLKRNSPLFSSKFVLPTRKDVDAPLLIGPMLFGLGWGLVGLCPGPAIVAVVIAPTSTTLFLLCMLAGMYIGRLFIAGTATRPMLG